MAKPPKPQEPRRNDLGDLTKLGNRVKQLRVERGLPQDKLALAANVDQSALSKLERGLLPMSKPALGRIAAALDVNLEELSEE